MKKIKVLLVALGVAAAAVGVLFFAMGSIYETTNRNTSYYYSRIDNSKISEIAPHGGMNYQYDLYVYKENGEGEEMKLDTSRELRDKAYIRIEVAPLRGVIGWAELLYEELPDAVQAQYGS